MGFINHLTTGGGPHCMDCFNGIWVWINTYENTIFRGMNIHKSQLF